MCVHTDGDTPSAARSRSPQQHAKHAPGSLHRNTSRTCTELGHRGSPVQEKQSAPSRCTCSTLPARQLNSTMPLRTHVAPRTPILATNTGRGYTSNRAVRMPQPSNCVPFRHFMWCCALLNAGSAAKSVVVELPAGIPLNLASVLQARHDEVEEPQAEQDACNASSPESTATQLASPEALDHEQRKAHNRTDLQTQISLRGTFPGVLATLPQYTTMKRA